MNLCTGLGALLGQLCARCSLRIACNCSKQVVVIGKMAPGANLRVAQDIIESNGRDLKKIVSRPMDIAGREVQVKSWGSHLGHESDLGIVKTTTDFLAILREDGGNLEEGWARLNLASSLAKVNLQQKLKDQEPLTEPERVRLEKKVLHVKTYASFAVMLWKLVCAHNCDLLALRNIGAISRNQYKLLRAKQVRHPNFAHGDTFASLHTSAKEVFLETARNLSREYLEKKRTQFEWFTHRDVENNSTAIHDYDRSGNNSPRLDGIRAIGMTSAAVAAHEASRNALDVLYVEFGRIDGEQGKSIQVSLGILRAKVIAIRLHLDPDALHDAEAPDITRMRAEMERLKQLDGSILYLFNQLKETIDLQALLEKKFITKAVLEKLIVLTIAHPDFFYAIKKAGELAALSPQFIAILSHLAEAFNDEQKEELNRDYLLKDWLAIDRDASLTPERHTSDEDEEEKSPEQ